MSVSSGNSAPTFINYRYVQVHTHQWISKKRGHALQHAGPSCHYNSISSGWQNPVLTPLVMIHGPHYKQHNHVKNYISNARCIFCDCFHIARWSVARASYSHELERLAVTLSRPAASLPASPQDYLSVQSRFDCPLTPVQTCTREISLLETLVAAADAELSTPRG